MAPPKDLGKRIKEEDLGERIKEEDLPSDGENNKTNPVATGTHEAQLNATPAAHALPSLVPETAGRGNASSGASSAQMHLNKPPLLVLHKAEVHVMKVCQDVSAPSGNDIVSRDKLETETIEFDSLLKYFIVSTMALTGMIAANPGVAGEASVQSEVKMVEAMATFLNERLGSMSDPSGGTAEEQARREEVRTGYLNRIEEIKKRLVTRRSQPGWWV